MAHRIFSTRRGFFKAGAFATGAALLIGDLSACKRNETATVQGPAIISEDKALSLIPDDFSYSDENIEPTHSWSLPIGTQLFPSEGTWVAALNSATSAESLVKASVFSAASGKLHEVVARTEGSPQSTVIYNVACSDEIYAWTELNISDKSWVLYAAPLKEAKLTSAAAALFKADANYDPPALVASGPWVFWQVQPSLSGNKTQEHSRCLAWRAGQAEAKQILESPGRFGARLSVSKGRLILVPRVLAQKGRYYGIVSHAIDGANFQELARLVLPQSVRPLRATQVGERFLFSIEASYSAGGLLSKMGTYIGTESQGFVKLDREPSEMGCGKDDRFIIKSRSSYLKIDLAQKSYSGIRAADRSLDYGDFPAREGETSEFLTFSTVKDAESGYPAELIVRSFKV